MYRRAYSLLVGVAAVMGVLALVVSIRYDQPLLDPEGKFLGPSWARLPILLALAIGVDLLPKAIWQSRGRPGSLWPAVRDRLRTHWNRERITLVFLGVGAWLGASAAIAAGIYELTGSVFYGVGSVALANLAGVGVVLWMMRTCWRDLALPRTRRMRHRVGHAAT